MWLHRDSRESAFLVQPKFLPSADTSTSAQPPSAAVLLRLYGAESVEYLRANVFALQLVQVFLAQPFIA